MTRHEPFGQCLQRILRQEGWSATKLAGLLGYKSRNSLFRILKALRAGDRGKIYEGWCVAA